MNYIEISNEIINSLKNSDLIERINNVEIKDPPNKEIIAKMYDTPSKIYLDDGGLYFFDNGDKTYCPEVRVTISEKGEWISDQLPNVGFDIDQNGNLRKSQEAESLYCLLVISSVLKDRSFSDDLERVISDYDFSQMRPNNDSNKDLITLLSEWQGLQSIVINILVSACRYKILDYKKDAEKYLRAGLTESEVAGLRDLESNIRKINFQYSEGVLSPLSINSLTKIGRLKAIDERNTKISDLIKNSKFGILYKILNLSSEYISPIKKKKIQFWVDAETTRLLSEKNYESLKEERSSIISQLTKRVLRIEKNSVRRLNVERYISDKENFKLPSKM